MVNADECKHDGATERRFGGAITCADCNRIIGYWKSPQPVLHMGPPIDSKRGA